MSFDHTPVYGKFFLHLYAEDIRNSYRCIKCIKYILCEGIIMCILFTNDCMHDFVSYCFVSSHRVLFWV